VVDIVSNVIARLIQSDHFQVAERALAVFHNQSVIAMVSECEEQALPIIFPALRRNKESHWHHGIATLSNNMLNAFHDINPVLFDRCLATYQHDRRHSVSLRAARWRLLEDMAARNNGQDPPVRPRFQLDIDSLADEEETDSHLERRDHTARATQLSPTEYAVTRKKSPRVQSPRDLEFLTYGRRDSDSAQSSPTQSASMTQLDRLVETGKTPAVSRNAVPDISAFRRLYLEEKERSPR
jgi:Protein phosphatase 2A regulatory B subunit (B56 family)